MVTEVISPGYFIVFIHNRPGIICRSPDVCSAKELMALFLRT